MPRGLILEAHPSGSLEGDRLPQRISVRNDDPIRVGVEVLPGSEPESGEVHGHVELTSPFFATFLRGSAQRVHPQGYTSNFDAVTDATVDEEPRPVVVVGELREAGPYQ